MGKFWCIDMIYKSFIVDEYLAVCCIHVVWVAGIEGKQHQDCPKFEHLRCCYRWNLEHSWSPSQIGILVLVFEPRQWTWALPPDSSPHRIDPWLLSSTFGLPLNIYPPSTWKTLKNESLIDVDAQALLSSCLFVENMPFWPGLSISPIEYCCGWPYIWYFGSGWRYKLILHISNVLYKSYKEVHKMYTSIN